MVQNQSRVPQRELGVLCYTSWVKQWSKAMDILLSFFVSRQIFLLSPMSEKTFEILPYTTESKGMLKTTRF